MHSLVSCLGIAGNQFGATSTPQPFSTQRLALRLVALVFTLVMGIAGFLLRVYVLRLPGDTLFPSSTQQVIVQLVTGSILAIPWAVLVFWLDQKGIWSEAGKRLKEAVLRLTEGQILWITLFALFAGTCEELFFRAFLQEWVGWIPASLLFVALHGYYFPKPRGMLRIGVTMTGLSLLLGYLYMRLGLLAAIALHTAYDWLVLWLFTRALRTSGERT